MALTGQSKAQTVAITLIPVSMGEFGGGAGEGSGEDGRELESEQGISPYVPCNAFLGLSPLRLFKLSLIMCLEWNPDRLAIVMVRV